MNLLALVFTAMATLPGNLVPNVEAQIVGGNEVSINEFPDQAHLTDKINVFCGATIINENYVLTASYCMDGINITEYSVQAGSADQATGQSVGVLQVKQSPNFNPVTKDSDITLLKLDSPLNYSETVQPISLQPQGVEVPDGTIAWVSGRQATSGGSQAVAYQVEVITNSECFKLNSSITSHMMCAQSLGPAACLGYSGGPVVANGTLIGVVSWEQGCTLPRSLVVCTKVSDLHDWIVSNM